MYDSKDDPEWGATGREIDVEAYAFAAERGGKPPQTPVSTPPNERAEEGGKGRL